MFFFLLACSSAFAQQLFSTARTDGFGSPSLLVGVSFTTLDLELGEDHTLLTVRASVGIGRKTDVFGSLDGVLAEDIADTKFLAWSLGLKHQFIRTGVVDLGAVIRVRGNRTDEERFEDALLDFAGVISIHSTPFYPYYAMVFSRPFGLDFTDEFQRTSIVGVEIPLGDVPRILAEVSLGDRRSFGAALRLAF